MINYKCAQGTPEWHAARAGVITASNFAMIRAKVGGLTDQQQVYLDAIRNGEGEAAALAAAGYKKAPTSTTLQRALAGETVGEFSEAAKNYAFRLAVERISGVALDEGGFESYAMRRGRELEPEARDAHSFQTGQVIEEAGFITTDDGLLGASADGLIGDNGGAEYKCFIDPEKLRDIILTRDISSCADQVQGGMMISGRLWWDFCLYCPALAKAGKELTIFRVARDEAYIAELRKDLLEFNELVDEYVEKIRS